MTFKEIVSRKKLILRIAAITIAVGLILTNTHLIFGLLTSVFPINSSGVIAAANIDVYWESGCINLLSSVNWGALSPGESTTITVYIKNEGSVSLTLGLNTDNWSPSGASTYFALSWNRQGVTIQPDSVISATLTLSVSENLQGITSFNFDIHVTGTETT